MSKFHNKLIGDLNRSIFLVGSDRVKIPVFITFTLDADSLDKSLPTNIIAAKYAKKWEVRLLEFINGSISSEKFHRFSFNFSYNVDGSMHHSLSYLVNVQQAFSTLKDNFNKTKEDSRIKYAQQTSKDLQAAYLNQDVNNTAYEGGSQLPDIED